MDTETPPNAGDYTPVVMSYGGAEFVDAPDDGRWQITRCDTPDDAGQVATGIDRTSLMAALAEEFESASVILGRAGFPSSLWNDAVSVLHSEARAGKVDRQRDLVGGEWQFARRVLGGTRPRKHVNNGVLPPLVLSNEAGAGPCPKCGKETGASRYLVYKDGTLHGIDARGRQVHGHMSSDRARLVGARGHGRPKTRQDNGISSDVLADIIVGLKDCDRETVERVSDIIRDMRGNKLSAIEVLARMVIGK